MQTCPYCKEQLLDGATKCRYCQSSLTPPSSAAKDARRITYIVDADLIRFAKFTAAVLAVFLVVGAYLFGFKLETSVEKVNALQKDVEKATVDLKASQLELQNAKAAVVALKANVESVLAQARVTLGEIGKQRDSAVAMVISIRELSPDQKRTLDAVKSSEPGKASGKWKYWIPNTTIRIAFLGGTAMQRDFVKSVAVEWARYANVAFAFTEVANSDVRIAFDLGGGSWSFVGTDVLGVAKSEPTMNLGWTRRDNVLHEFGHVLGLIEEHQNPNAGIRWNVAQLRKELGGPPNNWDEATIQDRVLKVVPRDKLGDYRPFDPRSIMAFPFEARLTGGVAVGGGTDLSESDKALVQRLYPR